MKSWVGTGELREGKKECVLNVRVFVMYCPAYRADFLQKLQECLGDTLRTCLVAGS